MEEALRIGPIDAEQNRRISETVQRERPRLRNFIRKHVADAGEAEDLLQDVFGELVEAYRLMKPIEEVGAWLYRVARNRITDLFRKKKPEALPVDEEGFLLTELLPSPDDGPYALYARRVLLDELESALAELPEAQREVFIAHEIEGRSFKELAVETDVAVNTLLSRKHYAVLYLRKRLQSIYDEFKKG